MVDASALLDQAAKQLEESIAAIDAEIQRYADAYALNQIQNMVSHYENVRFPPVPESDRAQRLIVELMVRKRDDQRRLDAIHHFKETLDSDSVQNMLQKLNMELDRLQR